MARQRLFLSLVVVLAFVLPIVAARPGGRLCHTSFFFPDPNNVRTVTLVGDVNGGFKLFSFASNGFFGSPSDLLQVRLHNLHKKMVFNPALSHSLALHTQANMLREEPFVDQVTHNQIVQTWSFSTSNPHHPITWINVRSRRALWRPDFTTSHLEPKPLRLDTENSPWIFAWIPIWFACFFVSALLMRALVRSFLMWFHGDHDDGGFVYGYQELPSSEASEKEVAQKEFAKETAVNAENVQAM